MTNKKPITDRQRKIGLWVVAIILIGGTAGLWFYLDWLWRACGGVGGDGC